MDFNTARHFLISQTVAPKENLDTFFTRLSQGEPPVPGQVTSLLLALKVVFEGLRQESTLDRQLAYALYLLSQESRQLFEAGRKSGISWPPLLDEDLTRIARAAKSIFADEWQS